MDMYEIDFRDIVKLNIEILTFFGIFPYEPDSFRWYIFHFVIVAVLTGLLYGSLLLAQFANTILSFQKGLLELVMVSYVALTNLYSAVKMFLVFMKRKRILALISTLNRNEFRPRSVYQRGILAKYIRASVVLTKILIATTNMACCFFSLYPFISEGALFLPLDAYIPYSTDDPKIFAVTYAIESFGIIVSAWCSITIDALMAAFIMVMCAQLSLLNDSLRNLHKHSLDEITENTSNRLEQAMVKNLTKCVRQHQVILQFKEEFESLFTAANFGQFLISVFILCATLYKLSSIKGNVLGLVSMTLYIFNMSSEVFILCYYGNEVIAKHNELTTSAYHCDWTKFPESLTFKRNLIFFMTRSQKGLRLLAGGYVTLSLETFVAIMKSSFSYFTVLNQIDV